MPDFGKMIENGFGDAVYAAMGQAFFTLSIGASGMAIFGSYIGRDRRLTGEAASVAGLSTLISLLAGLIIFPRLLRLWRFARFGSQPGIRHAAERLRPNVGGQLWGTLFFIFMSFAALLQRHWRVPKTSWRSAWTNGASRAARPWQSTPCSSSCFRCRAFWASTCVQGVQFPGIGDIQSLEDFIVSNNVLPLGGLVYVLFCTCRYGWGWKNFLTEANTGAGPRFPKWAHAWIAYGIPCSWW